MKLQLIIILFEILIMNIISYKVSNTFGKSLTKTSSLFSSIKLSNYQIDRLINIVDQLNNGLPLLNSFYPFVIKNKVYGYVHSDFWEIIKQYDIFLKSNNSIQLIPLFDSSSCYEITEALSKISVNLRDTKIIKGWRDELSRVVLSFNDDPICLIERSVYHYFGFKGYGVHVNGYVRDTHSNEITHMWVAKRSVNKSLWPSMFDHIVAGGQPFDISPMDNVIKECAEEANIPADMAKLAKPVGAVSYITSEGMQIKRDSLFCFDLELDQSFTPTPVDGEVDYFELQPIEWVLNKVVEGGSSGYKPNCNLVIIDFFIRNGIISSDTNRYLELVGKLRGPSCI